jgi:hypothetical protein
MATTPTVNAIGAARGTTPTVNVIEVAARANVRMSAGTNWAFELSIIASCVSYRTVHVQTAPRYRVIA